MNQAISPLTLPAATGGDGTLSYSLSPVPQGLNFDSGTRTLAGTPSTADTYNVTYTVYDADDDTDSISFSITVQDEDDGTAGPDLVVEVPQQTFNVRVQSCLLEPNNLRDPWPHDGAIGVSLMPTLSWHGGDSQCGNSVTYDVYLGVSPTLQSVVAAYLDRKSYSVSSPLESGTKYHWGVQAHDSNGVLIGAQWSFVTESDLAMPGAMFRECRECPEMIVASSGSFRMGSPSTEVGRDDDEGPVRTVTIAQPFAVGVYEVTFDEWDSCVADGGCGGYRPDDEGWGTRLAAGDPRELERRESVRTMVERRNGRSVSVVERVRVGVCGARWKYVGMEHRIDDHHKPGELWAQHRTDDSGGKVWGERSRAV